MIKQRLWQVAMPFAVLAVFAFGLRHTSAQSHGQFNDGVPKEASSSKDTATEQSVQMIVPPKRTGKLTRYLISTYLTVQDVQGVAFPGPKELKFLQKECSGFDIETCRHFRLPGGAHVLAMYDQLYFYSLVLIYRVPLAKGGQKAVDLTTKSGSLEAWLLRHKGHDYAEHYLPVEPWKKFLSLSPKKRSQHKGAFPMEGSIEKVVEDEFGLIVSMKNINLSSVATLPPFSEFLDHEEKTAKELYNWSIKRLDATDRTNAQAKESYEDRMRQLRYWREHKASERARIEGWLQGWWAGQPWNIIWP